MAGRGLFITFEGGEGGGKTTQIQSLANYLREAGYDVVTTREPGGTAEADKIRRLLVERDGGDWSPIAECLLFFAARVMHLRDLIEPALAEGKIVLCDRFTDSTRAYQCFGHGEVERAALEGIKLSSMGDIEPDLTLLLDIPAEEGLTRSNKRHTTVEAGGATEDRYERLNLAFHERLRNGYLELANEYANRFAVIDARQAPDAVFEDIRDAFEARIGLAKKAAHV